MKLSRLLILGIICFIISNFFITFCIIHGESMYPTYKDKQIVLEKKFLNNYTRGDIVVIKKNELKIIKRIIAIPNDTVIIKNNYVYVNNVKIDNLITEYSGIANIEITLGKDDEALHDSKVLFLSVWKKEKFFVNDKYLVKLIIDEDFGVINIKVYEKYTEKFITEVVWLFEQIEQRINEKCKNLVFVDADKCIKNNKVFFRYNSLSFFELKSVDTFYNLIKNGTISITFNIGVYKSGKYFGKPYNHGINFCIREKDVELLYNKILHIN